MIMTGEMIIDYYSSEGNNYSNPRMKLSRDVKEGKYIRLKRNLYESDPSTPRVSLAQAIYGPSYISFDYALSYYGMIPEYAVNVTSATTGKHKDKRFDTNICSFYYTDVPANVFSKEVVCIRMNNYSFNIATREKAVCDKLYKIPPVTRSDDFEKLLFDDLRLDEDMLLELDRSVISELSDLYKCRNVRMLNTFLKKVAAP